MLDIGWSEMAMVALLALLVIGPKDLPGLMRTVGQYVRKARGFARDFQSSLDEMIQDDELKEAKRAIEQQTESFRRRESFGIGKELERHVDPSGSLRAASREVNDTAREAVDSEDSGAARRAPASESDPYNAAENPLAPGGAQSANGADAGSREGESAPEGESPTGTVDEAEAKTETRIEVRETPVAPGHSLGAGHGERTDDAEAAPAGDRDGEGGAR